MGIVGLASASVISHNVFCITVYSDSRFVPYSFDSVCSFYMPLFLFLIHSMNADMVLAINAV
ncbi:hypothetical protein EDB87DRAFT_1602279 [Lactarius vividus]|nr:hypothetical protein EDB87DRAFT_1602279 [Lactarius vividus]